MDTAAQDKPERKDEELLILAAHHGFVDDVKTLVAKGVDVNSVDKKGTGSIHFAASKGHLDVVQLLLSKGVDVDVEDGSGRTPLHYASLGGSEEVVKMLMKKGAWVDGYDKEDDTALHMAIRQGNESVVRTLLKGGAKLNICNQKGLSALGESLASKQIEIASQLIENGADITEKSKGFSLLHLVAGLSDTMILKFMLSYLHPSKVTGPGGVSPLHCAALGESAECVEMLIKHGADPSEPDDDGNTAYSWAKGAKANEDILKLLDCGSQKKKKKGAAKNQGASEIQPADGPEGEWNTFMKMSEAERMKQIEAWANSPEELGPLGRLAFLNPDGRKAVSEVGHFMRLIECRKAIRAIQTDEEFQEDVGSAHVQEAVLEVSKNPATLEKYLSDTKVMGVVEKLKALQQVLRRNGQQKIVFDDLVAPNASSSSAEEPSLERQLEEAKDAVMNAVMNDMMEQKKALDAASSKKGSWLRGFEGNSGDEDGESAWRWDVVKSELFRTAWISVLVLAVAGLMAWFFEIDIFKESKKDRMGSLKDPHIVSEEQFERLRNMNDRDEL